MSPPAALLVTEPSLQSALIGWQRSTLAPGSCQGRPAEPPRLLAECDSGVVWGWVGVGVKRLQQGEEV